MLAVQFKPVSMSAEQYDRVMEKLKEAGADKPKGRIIHTSFGDKSNLRIFGVWDTKESFEEFGKILFPILQSEKINLGSPEVSETHSVIY